MKNLMLRVGVFALNYCWLATAIAMTLVLTIQLLMDLGELRPEFHVDMGVFAPLLVFVVVYGGAGFDLRRLLEDRRHG